MPDQSHVGRQYGPVRYSVSEAAVAGFSAAIGSRRASGGVAPPTFAAVYCLRPVLQALLDDAELGLSLDGLIHSEQSFEWSAPVRVGDVIDAAGAIESLEARRGLLLIGLSSSATNQDGDPVCRGLTTLLSRLHA